MGAEVNEMVLTFPQGLNFLCQQEHGRKIQEADQNLKVGFRAIQGS
jgi:hypothetical protein